MLPPSFRRATGVTAATILVLLLLCPAAGAKASAQPIQGRTAAVLLGQGKVKLTIALRSTKTVRVKRATVCVKDAAGGRHDLPARKEVRLTSKKRSWSGTATFPAGTYRYWACVKKDRTWAAVENPRTFTVASPAPATGMPATPPAGWRRVFADDFTDDLPAGRFPGAYSGRWASYDGFPNTSKDGDYDKSIISVHGGAMDLHLGARNGRPKVAAPVPLIGGKWDGQVYGRYSVRMRADPLAGYGVAFLLWSDRNVWDDGEIDFPEGGLAGTFGGFNHCPGDPQRNCHWFQTGEGFDPWHTYTIEWTPKRLSYLLDGKVISSTTEHIPERRMHWVLQVETPQKQEALRTSGHILVDWATIDALG